MGIRQGGHPWGFEIQHDSFFSSLFFDYIVFYLYFCICLRKSGKQMQEKHCDIVLLTEFAKNSYGRIEHFCFRLLRMQLALTPTAYPQA